MSFNGNVVLCKPKDTAITVSIMTNEDLDVYLEYGTSSETYGNQTSTVSATSGVPYEQTISSLSANTQYYYRVQYRTGTSGPFTANEENKFHTQRNTSSGFKFTVIADSHFGDSGHYDATLYGIASDNILDDSPDLHFDIGDAFMINLLTNPDESDIDTEYKTYRPVVGALAKSVPWMFCTGNREMIRGWLLDGTADNDAVWSANAKKKYYPQPTDDSFYSANTNSITHIGLPEDYYSFTWGDAKFIVIFPWLYTETNPGQSGDEWDWTIGDDQYTWFKSELENATEKFKFVFVHHVLGGVRGGAKWAKKFEWGGENDSGTYEFDTKRSTWVKTLHQLMAENGVNIIFHGHDHIYVKQDLDGFVYQACPLAADDQYRLLNDGDYDSGIKHPNSGHVRVTVNTNDVDVDYVRAYLPGDGTNKTITHSYTVANTTAPFITLLNPSSALPKTDIDINGINFGSGVSGDIIHFQNRTYTYPHNKINSWTDTKISVEVPQYACNKFGAGPSITRDVWMTVGSTDTDKEVLTILKPANC